MGKSWSCNVCGGYCWLDVKDELPDHNDNVLVIETETGIPVVMLAHYYDGDWYRGDPFLLKVTKVSHWMPMPDFPEVD